MEIKFIELNKSIKSKLENLYNVKGDDVFLIRQTINNIKNFVIKDLEEFNYTKIDAASLKVNSLDAELSTMPIGNDYRFVVLENLNNDCVDFLDKYDFTDSSTIVLTLNIDNLKNATNIDCSALNRADISKYILNTIAKAKISIQEQALDYLIDSTNSNMSKINTELNKMISYVGLQGVIDMDVATNLVANSSEYVVYMLTGAIDHKNYAEYQKILKDMLKSQTAGEIFSYLGKYFRRMQYVAINKDDALLGKILNIKPYAIKMSRQSVSKNGVNYYVNLYQKYAELDYEIKSGKISAYNALYSIIF